MVDCNAHATAVVNARRSTAAFTSFWRTTSLITSSSPQLGSTNGTRLNFITQPQLPVRTSNNHHSLKRNELQAHTMEVERIFDIRHTRVAKPEKPALLGRITTLFHAHFQYHTIVCRSLRRRRHRTHHQPSLALLALVPWETGAKAASTNAERLRVRYDDTVTLACRPVVV